MYQIKTVILFSFVVCVLSDQAPDASKESSCPKNSSTIRDSRDRLNSCFQEAVQTHLDSNVTKPLQCHNFTDFNKNISSHFDLIRRECKGNGTEAGSIEPLLELIEFSLANGTFKDFYSDIECVRNLEINMSSCVKSNTGFFNISEKKKHSSWIEKNYLKYESHNCESAADVKNCTEKVLNSCKPTTRRYVSSLFEKSMKRCNDTGATSPDVSNESVTGQSTFIIVISVVAVTVALAIGFLIIYKITKRRRCGTEGMAHGILSG